MTALMVPGSSLGAPCWRRSLLVGLLVVNLDVSLGVVWSFCLAGAAARSILPPVVIGPLAVNGVILFVHRRQCRAT